MPAASIRLSWLRVASCSTARRAPFRPPLPVLPLPPLSRWRPRWRTACPFRPRSLRPHLWPWPLRPWFGLPRRPSVLRAGLRVHRGPLRAAGREGRRELRRFSVRCRHHRGHARHPVLAGHHRADPVRCTSSAPGSRGLQPRHVPLGVLGSRLALRPDADATAGLQCPRRRVLDRRHLVGALQGWARRHSCAPRTQRAAKRPAFLLDRAAALVADREARSSSTN